MPRYHGCIRLTDCRAIRNGKDRGFPPRLGPSVVSFSHQCDVLDRRALLQRHGTWNSCRLLTSVGAGLLSPGFRKLAMIVVRCRLRSATTIQTSFGFPSLTLLSHSLLGASLPLLYPCYTADHPPCRPLRLFPLLAPCIGNIPRRAPTEALPRICLRERSRDSHERSRTSTRTLQTM